MIDNHFMQRCFDLARRGAGAVAPNPMVGAVLVHQGKIIGEGWHQRFGEAHAEVNAVASVAAADRKLLPYSTLYCSLEPCFHHGKTPPCVDLVLRERIGKVVVSNTDPNPLVAGKSIEKMRSAGIDVVTGVCEQEGRYLNRAFYTWIEQRRPHVILKWARSTDGYIGRKGERIPVSGPVAQRLVHRWRSECPAIMVGTHTALADNPRLDNRYYPGRSPVRIAMDFRGQIPLTHHLLDDSMPTWIIGRERPGQWLNTRFLDFRSDDWMAPLLEALRASNCGSLLVEGGANIHQQFLDAGMADEIRLLHGAARLGDGVGEASLGAGWKTVAEQQVGADRLEILIRS